MTNKYEQLIVELAERIVRVGVSMFVAGFLFGLLF